MYFCEILVLQLDYSGMTTNRWETCFNGSRAPGSFGTVQEHYLFQRGLLEKVLGALKTEYYTTCCVSAKLPKLWPTAVSQCIFQVKCLTDFQVPMRESAQTDFLKYAFNWKKCNKMTRELECIFVGYQFYSSITPEWLPTGGKIVPMVPGLLGDLEL